MYHKLFHISVGQATYNDQTIKDLKLRILITIPVFVRLYWLIRCLLVKVQVRGYKWKSKFRANSKQ